MNYSRCAKCSCKLSDGDLKYRITIDIVEDHGGLLSDLQEEIAEQVYDLLCQMEEIEPEELGRETCEENTFVLCKECADCFSKNPFGGSSRLIPVKMGSSHLLH